MWRACTSVAAFCIVAAGCAGSDSEELAKVLATAEYTELGIDREQVSLAVGQQLELQAVAHIASGEQTPVETHSWFIENPSIAEVTARGVVTAKSPGTTLLGYEWHNKTITTPISVSAAILESLELSMDSQSVDECTAGTVNVSGTLSDGTVLSQLESPVWSVSDEEKVVLQTHNATSETSLKYLRSGVAQLTVSQGAISHSIDITINDTLSAIEPEQTTLNLTTGEPVRITIAGIYSDGSSKDIAAIVTLSEPQETSQSTSSGDVSDSTTMNPTPEDSSTLTLNNDVQPGDSEADSSNPVLLDTDKLSVTLTEDDSLEITGKVNSSTSLQLHCGDLQETISIEVEDPAVLTGVTFEQNQWLLAAGESVVPLVYATYSDGSRTEVTENLSWSIEPDDNNFFSLDSVTGTVTAAEDIVVEKSIELTVSLDTFTDTASVFAEFGEVETLKEVRLLQIDSQGDLIELPDAEPLEVLSNDVTQLVVQHVYNTDRTAIELDNVYWSNADPSIAVVNSTGHITGIASGITSITAVSAGLTKSVLVRVATSADDNTDSSSQ